MIWCCCFFPTTLIISDFIFIKRNDHDVMIKMGHSIIGAQLVSSPMKLPIPKYISPKASLILYISCVVLCSLLIYFFAESFRSSPIAPVLAGFIGCMVFFFIVISFSSISIMMGRDGTPSWKQVLFSLVVTFGLCFLVNEYCAVFCLFFCIPLTVYLYHLSKTITPYRRNGLNTYLKVIH